mmetsp:Transcript_10034/g.9744  ORF Transcript_10034/g.9744 Transcript_10034/m.9744 type:complete len:94 (+) Transcript_10034:272-553(+)
MLESYAVADQRRNDTIVKLLPSISYPLTLTYQLRGFEVADQRRSDTIIMPPRHIEGKQQKDYIPPMSATIAIATNQSSPWTPIDSVMNVKAQE